MAAVGIKVTGVDSLNKKFDKAARKASRISRNTYNVGYEAPYAIYVHENVEMKLKGLPRPSGIGVYWGPNGQAKFLEEPARRLRKSIKRRVVSVLKKTGDLEEALFAGGELLLEKSQAVVPVEYGDLVNSGFVEVETYQ